jgi:hypothetical protein
MLSAVPARRFVFAALCASAVALLPFIARAGEAEDLRSDVTAALDAMFASEGEKVLFYDAVEVQGAAAPYDIAIRGIKLGAAGESSADIGTISFRLVPLREGVYEVSDLKLPAVVAITEPTGESAGKLEIASQSFKGVWSSPLQSFLSMDGNFTGLKGTDGTGAEMVSVASVVMKGDSKETSPGHWDQDASVKISGLKVAAPEGPISMGELEVATDMRNVDLPAVEALVKRIEELQEAAAMPPPPAPDEPQPAEDSGFTGGQAGADEGAVAPDVASPDVTLPDGDSPDATAAEAAAAAALMEMLRGLPVLFGDASSRIVVRGLSHSGPDGKKVFDLGEGGIEFGFSDFDKEKVAIRFAFHYAGLDGAWDQLVETEESMGEQPPEPVAPDPQTVALAESLAPRDLTIDVRLEDLPGKLLWEGFLETIAAEATDPTKPDYERDLEGAAAFFGMSAMGALQEAGSKIRLVDSKFVSKVLRATFDGQIQSAATPTGAIGALNLEIVGLDDAIELVKANVTGPEAANDTAPLELMRAFSERRTEADGTVVDRYVLSLDESGAVLLNGKDFQFLLNAMEPTAPGSEDMPMPENMPMPDEMPAPEEMPSDMEGGEAPAEGEVPQ